MKLTKRNETKIFRSCWKCNKFKNRKFCCWFWMIVCWFDDLIWNCCKWLFFFFLSNDVSTFQKNNYCKNHFDVNELIDSKKQKNRLLIKCRKFEEKNRQLIVIFANSRSFSLIYDAHNENEMQSLFSKKKFQIDDFF